MISRKSSVVFELLKLPSKLSQLNYCNLSSVARHQVASLLLPTTYQSSVLLSTSCHHLNPQSNEEHPPPLTKETAHQLVLKLTEDERTILLTSLKQFEADLRKEEYRGQLAAFRWRSKFGRPTKVPRLGDVDPTGSYCPVPEDWLIKKYAEIVPKPTTPQLLGVAIHNAIPFVGFGFLDNFVMIVCGDYIDVTLGSYLFISTMAAAALGNTFSDVLGIGSAWYVERFAAKVGVKAPALSPIQLDMTSCRLFSNLGRVVGVTIGCLLGMFPLMFLNTKESAKEPAEPPEQ